MAKNKNDEKTKTPDVMSYEEYKEWRGEPKTGPPKIVTKNSVELDSYPIKRKYGVVITEREVEPGIILTSREFIGVPPRKFKTLIEKEDDKLLKNIFSSEGPKYYPSEVFLIIKKAKPEIDGLWQYVWKAYKNSEYDERTGLEILKDASLKWVTDNKPSMLKNKYFENETDLPYDDQYPDERGLKRNFIGKLLQKIISDNFPSFLPDSQKTPKHFGLKNLYELYSEF